MSYNNLNELDFTTEQLDFFKQEMLKYRLPWIAKIWKKVGVPFIRYSILPAVVLILILGIIYNASISGNTDWMWGMIKGIGLFYIFGFGSFTLAAHLAERITANKLRKRLGLSQREFEILVIAFQITGM